MKLQKCLSLTGQVHYFVAKLANTTRGNWDYSRQIFAGRPKWTVSSETCFSVFLVECCPHNVHLYRIWRPQYLCTMLSLYHWPTRLQRRQKLSKVFVHQPQSQLLSVTSGNPCWRAFSIQHNINRIRFEWKLKSHKLFRMIPVTKMVANTQGWKETGTLELITAIFLIK